jgi:sugar-specific transcriptional regulator TrmB
MDFKLLEEIGLTEGEAKVYAALLRLGSTKTGPLASKAGVSSSKVYKILERLEKKGIVGHVLKGEVKHFTALEPRRLMDYMEEREEQLQEKKRLVEKMLPELEKQKSLGRKSEATVYSGFRASTNFFRGIVEELKPGETYYVIGAGYGEGVPGLYDFFYRHHLRRAKRGVRVKMLANHDVRGTLVETTKHKSEVRFLPEYLITNMEIVFYKNKVYIILAGDELIGFLLENEEAAKGFRKYFNMLWKISKK